LEAQETAIARRPILCSTVYFRFNVLGRYRLEGIGFRVIGKDTIFPAFVDVFPLSMDTTKIQLVAFADSAAGANRFHYGSVLNSAHSLEIDVHMHPPYEER
jgi:hypothetical protein